MNHQERQMLDILKRGRDEFGYTAVKAEFEAEGTRTDELLRLMEIARKANLDLGLKIGGCEAMRDLMEAKQIGVEYVIAPMIESAYALSKYIDAKNIVYTPEEQRDTRFLFNLETEAAFGHLEELVEMAKQPGGADGIVFGRVDFTLSTGRDRDEINSDGDHPLLRRDCGSFGGLGMDYVVGGGVSMDSVDVLRTIRSCVSLPLRDAQSHFRRGLPRERRPRQGTSRSRAFRTSVAREQAGLLRCDPA